MYKACYSSVLLLLPFLLLLSCSKDDPAPETPFSVDIFYKSMNQLVIEVAYEEQAEPFVDILGKRSWDFTEINIESLFATRPVVMDVTVPYSTNEMTMIPNQNKAHYTIDDILSLAALYRFGTNTDSSGNIFVLFLDGLFVQNDTARNNILGVNIKNTSITAIFKPVIIATDRLPLKQKFVEQTTVVHELGHALGLVDNGVSLQSNHHDEDHEAHCTNPGCVMYWANERSSSVAAFVENFLGEFKVVFGPECLEDTRLYQP